MKEEDIPRVVEGNLILGRGILSQVIYTILTMSIVQMREKAVLVRETMYLYLTLITLPRTDSTLPLTRRKLTPTWR